MTVPMEEADRVLRFWFGDGAEAGQPRREWFVKDPHFDDAIRSAFGGLIELALQGHCGAWLEAAPTSLALIVVLDQLPRNAFRGTARAFAGDTAARTAARHVLTQGYDRRMRPVERQFCYLPFEHSEDLADQDLAVALMADLKPFAETADAWLWAEKHREVIQRFGRFPHRNALLGRPSTAEELDFLTQPGSSF